MNENNQVINLLPEWQTSTGIILVWPGKLDSGVETKLTPFYKKLINIIQENSKVKITLLTCMDPDEVRQVNKFTGSLQILKAPVKDVWVKDFAPLQVKTGNSIAGVKALYSPSYHSKTDQKYSDAGEEVGKILLTQLKKSLPGLKYENEDIILDGGNIINNGEGVVITTAKTISDNESISPEELTSAFKERLGARQVIFLPVEKGDVTGHIDGMVRFLNKQTVAVASYPKEYQEGKSFYDRIAKTLERKGFNVVRLMNEVPIASKRFPSALGNYLNFLRIGSTIYLPTYEGLDQLNESNRSILKEYADIVVPVDCTSLSEYGGVLNCISYNQFALDRSGVENIPSDQAGWTEIQRFALSFNGYEFSANVAEITGRHSDHYFNEREMLPGYSLDELRATLFFTQRAIRHRGDRPHEVELEYCKELIRQIRDKAKLV